MAVLPFFSNRAFPPIAKAGFSVALTLLLAPVLTTTLPAVHGTIADYFLLALRESACGILLGFAGQFLFYAVEICGQLIGFQSGLSIVSSIDPNSQIPGDVLTQAYRILTMLLFLTFNGLHFMLSALAQSFDVVPLGAFTLDGRIADWVVTTGTQVIAAGIQLAAPVMVTLLLTDIGLGILARVAPTMNIFVLGFPLKIGITLIMVSLTLGIVVTVFQGQFTQFMRSYPEFLKLMVHP
jgi:flagellar biosynthetic protein FliR